MANEPERPIENLLRTYAEQRRRQEGTPIELHPVDRRKLQAEVARVFGTQTNERQGFLRGVINSWPRLAWGLALVLGVGLLAVVFLPKPSPDRTGTELASNERRAAPYPQVEQDLHQSSKVGVRSKEAEVLPSVASTASATANATDFVDKGLAAAPKAELDQSLLQLRTEKDALVASRNLQRAGAESGPSAAPSQSASFLLEQSPRVQEQLQRQAVQQFAQALDEPKVSRVLSDQAKAGPGLLTSFRVEQTGQDLRVVDGDGSVYTGRLTAPAPAAPRNVAQTTARSRFSGLASASNQVLISASASNVPVATPESYSFRVVGTNVTLKQKVIFSGQLLPLVSSFGGRATTNSPITAVAGQLISPAQQGFPSIPDCQIFGKAVVNSGQEITIHALPSK